MTNRGRQSTVGRLHRPPSSSRRALRCLRQRLSSTSATPMRSPRRVHMAEVEGEIGNNEAASGAAPPSSYVLRPLVGIKSRSSSTLGANRRAIICIGPAIVAGAAASDCTMRYVNGRQRETSAVKFGCWRDQARNRHVFPDFHASVVEKIQLQRSHLTDLQQMRSV